MGRTSTHLNGTIPKAGLLKLRPVMVVIMPPGGEHRAGLSRLVNFLVEALVPEAGVEALDKPVLPRHARRDVVLLDVTIL